MKEFGLSPGPSSAAWVQESNQPRIFHAERRAEADTIEARTSRRKERLQLTDDDSKHIHLDQTLSLNHI